MGTAHSFEHRTDSVARAARLAADATRRVARPAALVLFASGSLAERLDELAHALAAERLGFPALLVAGAGVLTERGEIEGQAAVAGMVWAGGEATPVAVSGRTPDDLGEALARAVADRVARTAATVLTFGRAAAFSAGSLEPLAAVRGARHVFGGGAPGRQGAVALGADGEVLEGDACLLVLRGLHPPQLVASPACRLLAPFHTITEVRGALVTHLDGEPALEALTRLGPGAQGQVLLTVLAEDAALAVERGGRAERVVRGVQGVDPSRHGIVISDEVRPGMRLGFAVRDGASARSDLEACVRDVCRSLGGAAPRFALYVNCAGRGAALHGTPDADVRVLRHELPGVPLAGVASAFEIGPHGGRPTLHLYSGVLALFASPS